MNLITSKTPFSSHLDDQSHFVVASNYIYRLEAKVNTPETNLHLTSEAVRETEEPGGVKAKGGQKLAAIAGGPGQRRDGINMLLDL